MTTGPTSAGPTSVHGAMAGLLLSVALTTTLTVGGREAGAADGACPTSEGVTVVVDFQELGGGLHVRCAPGAVTSGLDALTKAGIGYQTATRQPGFLCKIDGKPSDDPCQNTSPASAYWSYWVAPRGGQWCYSDVGAGYRVPPAGSVEGWSFSKNKSAATAPAPGIAVPAAVEGSPGQPPKDCRNSTSAPPAPAPPSTAPSPGSGSPGSTPGVAAAGRPPAAGGAPATPKPGVTTTPNPATVQPADSSTSTTFTAPTPTGAPEVDVRGESTARDEDTTIDTETAAVDLGDNGADDGDSGSPLGVVVAVALVGALGLGANLWRRRANSD